MMINDYVHLTAEAHTEFRRICQSVANYKKDGMFYTPNDLLVANTVPLKDVVLINETTKDSYEIRIAHTGWDMLKDCEDDTPVVVGNITIKDAVEVSMDIVIKKSDPDLLLNESAFINGVRMPKDRILAITPPGWLEDTSFLFSITMSVWYGIQIALLNPYVKDVFRTETIRKTAFNPNGKKRKSVVKYIRHHYLNPGVLSPKTEAGQMLRKTMAWYVVGHWRHYQDGKTIFIQPYWKGPLRETKACEPRERKVV